jgi:uncharacterized membrane protein
MQYMLLAGALFLAAHLGISSTGLRPRLVGLIGERGYLGLYSLLAFATLGYLIWLYGALPRYDYLWTPTPALYMAAKVLTPIALILAIGSFMVKNPTSLGMETVLQGAGGGVDVARGVVRITRHPFQWGVVIWAIAHLLANGDSISVVFFATFLLLSGVGTMLMDRRKAATLGADWQGYLTGTSNLPFLAIAQGRNRLVIAELWQPVVVGLVAAAAIAWGHEWLSGVRII